MQSFNQKKVTIPTETQDIASKISNIIGQLKFADENDKEFSLSSYIHYLLKAAENSDQSLRAEIENNIVKLGVKAVPYLINSLMTIKGTARGLAAMAIIRIGLPAVKILKDKAIETENFGWMAEYIINEIVGTQSPLALCKAEAQVELIAG